MRPNESKLADAMWISIVCEYCAKLECSYDVIGPDDFAESLWEEGWRVNRADKVKCPKCVKKMKR